MSDENVEIVRRAYDAWNSGAPKEGAALFDPAIEWTMPPNLPETGTWSGEDEVWTLRDGKVVRVTMYSGTADALDAVGLRAP